MRPLIRCKTTRKAYYQRVWTYFIEHRNNARRFSLISQPSVHKVTFYVIDKFFFQVHTQRPNIFVADVVNLFPDFGIGLILIKSAVEILFVNPFHRRRCPRWQVNSVGNVSNVQFLRKISFPNGLKHFLRNQPVQFTYSVGFLSRVESKNAHREFLVRTRFIASHIHKLLPRNTHFSYNRLHVLADKRFVEIIVPCRNRSVHGIKSGCTNNLQRFVKRQFFFRNVIQQALSADKSSVPFVHVVHIFLDAQLFQQQHSAHTQQIFLLHAVFPVAAVKLAGNGAVVFAVVLQIGIHQIQIYASYRHFPYIRVNGSVVKRHFQNHRFVVFVHHLSNGQAAEVLRFVVGNLLPVHRKGLREITVTIQETHGSHIYPAVAGFFQIIAGQHPESAGVDFQHVRQAVFHAEISDARPVFVKRNVQVIFVRLISTADSVH